MARSSTSSRDHNAAECRDRRGRPTGGKKKKMRTARPAAERMWRKRWTIPDRYARAFAGPLCLRLALRPSCLRLGSGTSGGMVIAGLVAHTHLRGVRLADHDEYENSRRRRSAPAWTRPISPRAAGLSPLRWGACVDRSGHTTCMRIVIAPKPQPQKGRPAERIITASVSGSSCASDIVIVFVLLPPPFAVLSRSLLWARQTQDDGPCLASSPSRSESVSFTL